MDIETALGVAARIWCDHDYSHIVINAELAEKIAHLLKNEADEQSARAILMKNKMPFYTLGDI